MSDEEPTTFDVRVWSVTKRVRRDGPRYRVRWIVAGKEWHDTFPTRALADSFRSGLVSTTRREEAFVIATGRPVSWQRPEEQATSWYEHALAYVDMKWPHAAGKSRQGIAESLATVTPALFADARSRPLPRPFGNFSTTGRSTPVHGPPVLLRTSWPGSSAGSPRTPCP